MVGVGPSHFAACVLKMYTVITHQSEGGFLFHPRQVQSGHPQITTFSLSPSVNDACLVFACLHASFSCLQSSTPSRFGLSWAVTTTRKPASMNAFSSNALHVASGPLLRGQGWGRWYHAYGRARPGQVRPHFMVSKKRWRVGHLQPCSYSE
jgi:hypothetical protein